MFKRICFGLFLTFLIVLCITHPTIIFAQDSTVVGGADTEGDSFGDILRNNWPEVLGAVLGLFEVLIRLFRTPKDYSIFNFIKSILDKVIANRASTSIGGGKLGFLPPSDATTHNVVIKDIRTGTFVSAKTGESIPPGELPKPTDIL